MINQNQANLIKKMPTLSNSKYHEENFIKKRLNDFIENEITEGTKNCNKNKFYTKNMDEFEESVYK